MEIFKLFGSVFVDTTDADKKIEKTNKKGKGIGETLSNGIKTAGKWGAAILGAATTAGAAIIGMATKVAANCDEIDKMSQKLGMSREAYQEWDYILSQNGADINSLSAGMKTLTATMDKVTEGNATAKSNFDKLGISVYDTTGKLKSQEQMFEETVSALQNMEDGTEKARLATELFGKQGQELMPLLNGEAGSVEELKQKAHDLGMVLGDETVDAGVSFTDTMDTLKRVGAGLFNTLGGTVMPIVEEFANTIIDNMPMIKSIFAEITPMITNYFSQVMPLIMNLVKSILPVLFNLMQQIVPVMSNLLQTILPVLVNLLDMLLPPILQIIEAVLPILIKLLNPILQLLQPVIELLQPIIDLFMALLMPLLDLIDLILPPLVELLSNLIQMLLPALQSALQFVSDLLSGVFKSAIENIITTVQNIIEFISNIFTGNWQGAWENVKNIFSIYFDGIKNTIDNIKNVFSGIIEFVKTVFTAVWQGVWENVKTIFFNVFNNIKNMVDTVKNVFSNIIDFIRNVFTGNWQGAWQNVKNIFTNIASGLGNAFKAPLNFVIDLINNFIRGLNKIQIPDWVPGVGGRGFHIGEIPKLKVGMDYVPEDDFPALLHKGEAVLTKEQNAEYKQTQSRQIKNIDNNSGSNLEYYLQKMIDIFLAYFPQFTELMERDMVFEDGTLAARLTPGIDRNLSDEQTRRRRGN